MSTRQIYIYELLIEYISKVLIPVISEYIGWEISGDFTKKIIPRTYIKCNNTIYSYNDKVFIYNEFSGYIESHKMDDFYPIPRVSLEPKPVKKIMLVDDREIIILMNDPIINIISVSNFRVIGRIFADSIEDACVYGDSIYTCENKINIYSKIDCKYVKTLFEIPDNYHFYKICVDYEYIYIACTEYGKYKMPFSCINILDKDGKYIKNLHPWWGNADSCSISHNNGQLLVCNENKIYVIEPNTENKYSFNCENKISAIFVSDYDKYLYVLSCNQFILFK